MRAKDCLFRSVLAFSALFFFLPAVSQAQVIASVGAGVAGCSTDPRSPETDRSRLSSSALLTVEKQAPPAATNVFCQPEQPSGPQKLPSTGGVVPLIELLELLF